MLVIQIYAAISYLIELKQNVYNKLHTKYNQCHIV